jgi:hypothetical protein
LFCGYNANADENAASNIAERFGDDEINQLSFRELETVLALRFLRRHPVARSATAGLELHVVPIFNRNDMPRGKGSAPTVNQPSQHLCLE